jgi:hypothetical protein
LKGLVQCHVNIDRSWSPDLQRNRMPASRAATGGLWVLLHIALGAMPTPVLGLWGYSEIFQKKQLAIETVQMLH